MLFKLLLRLVENVHDGVHIIAKLLVGINRMLAPGLVREIGVTVDDDVRERTLVLDLLRKQRVRLSEKLSNSVPMQNPAQGGVFER